MGATLERFVSLRRVPMKAVLATALVSWALQAYAFATGQPFYLIVILAVIPWIPLALFEGLWKYQHYSWMAVFAVVTALQVLHMGEHFLQVTQLSVLNGTLACPPPSEGATFATRIVMPDAAGQPTDVVGPAACGVLGFLDFELVHLVWDTAVWLGALWLLTKFPRNAWLWVAMIFASIHEVEHLFLGYIYYVETAAIYTYPKQMWDLVRDGNILTAVPAGIEVVPATFYEAGGKTGILGRGGLVEVLLFGEGSQSFLLRPYLHFGYNSLVVIPTVIAFLVQARKVRDEYLAKALPTLTEEQMIQATPLLEREAFDAGEVIIRQGDIADKFYIITRGDVEVLREQPGGRELVITRLGPGQYFGEIGLLHGGKRTATVRAAGDVEVMSLDRNTFASLMDSSELSKAEVERLVRQRVRQLHAMKTGG
ncbi:cyclic nucleotide-binding domain-containing protein [Rubrobacter taiwanensis]|jgi:hypothetical protein|uniref:Cyclic nucleotide-binding domain-containing protein n=1 Tax=Rubrobacter taiwanensis TaxID=185139 RepID=A0A4R1BQI9_9ACTN|nr:cyclic nucleotide-binding domain-containing protein [Rubrobacter taiwanensis]TCJ19828.1 cyclic nucleotide-binding domain-containing protein [Rubrobacter taiwanensis]